MGKISVNTGKASSTINTTTVWDRIIDLENSVGSGNNGLVTRVGNVESSLAHIATNVKSFGAKGDGVNDDAPAIQAAINSMPSNGGVVYFPKGVYKIGNASDGKSNDIARVLVSKSNVKLLGYGATILNGVTMGISTFQLTGTNISVEGLKFDGQNNSGNQIHITYTARKIELRNCEIANCKQQTGDTVVASGIMISCGAENVTIDRCHIHHIDAPITKVARGIWGTGYGANGNTYFKGIHVHNSLFEDITPIDDADGIQLQPTTVAVNIDSSVVNCKFYRCAKRGIKAQGSGMVIDGNIIELGAKASPMYSGISVYGDNIRVVNNQIIGGYASHGIEGGSASIDIADRIVIAHNTIKMTETTSADSSDGIAIFGDVAGTFTANDLVITGNTIENVFNGIYLDVIGKRASISDNTLNTCYQYGIFSNKKFDNIAFIGNVLNNITKYVIRSNSTGINIVMVGNVSDGTGWSPYTNVADRSTVSTGNLVVGIPTQVHGTQKPTSGTWQKGDIVWNTSPSSAGYIGWVCTFAGTPGNWKGFGNTPQKGTTANRITGLGAGDEGTMYLDTTLNANGKPIFWNGSAWVDSTGATV